MQSLHAIIVTTLVITVIGLPAPTRGSCAERRQSMQRYCLVRHGEPRATLVIGDGAGPLTWRAARVFSDLGRHWVEAELPILQYRDWRQETASDSESRKKRDEVCIVIGDAHHNGLTASLLAKGLALPVVSEEGYCVTPFPQTTSGVEGNTNRKLYVVIAGGSPRAEYYAVEYLRRLHCDTSGRDLWLELPPSLTREPAFRVRANYYLTCWNNAHYFTLDYYQDALDSMAAAGTNAVFFWIAGLYESERYPETYRLRPSVMQPPQIRKLIDHAHSLGMEFYLLDGICGWSLGMAFPEKHPEVKGKGVLQCPAQPLSTELNLGYLKEQLTYFPNADGFAYEMGSEYGLCQCPLCSKVIDRFGSHAFGQYQLDFLEKSARALWAAQPKLKFVYNIGYECNEEPAYYQRIHAMKDPRLLWWIVRQNWSVPGPDGKPAPIQEALGDHTLLHWDQTTDIPTLLARLPRVRQTGMAGYVTSDSPGAQHPLLPDREPYFPESLPFQIERLAYHLLTWDPGLTESQVWDAVRRTYFSADMRDEKLWSDFRWLVTDAWKTIMGSWEHELYMVRNHVPYDTLPDSMEGWQSLTCEKVQQIEENVQSLKYLTPEQGQALYDFLGHVSRVIKELDPRVRETENRIRSQQKPSAKTADTLKQMQDQIEDIHRVLTNPTRLERAQRQLVEAGLARVPVAKPSGKK